MQYDIIGDATGVHLMHTCHASREYPRREPFCRTLEATVDIQFSALSFEFRRYSAVHEYECTYYTKFDHNASCVSFCAPPTS